MWCCFSDLFFFSLKLLLETIFYFFPPQLTAQHRRLISGQWNPWWNTSCFSPWNANYENLHSRPWAGSMSVFAHAFSGGLLHAEWKVRVSQRSQGGLWKQMSHISVWLAGWWLDFGERLSLVKMLSCGGNVTSGNPELQDAGTAGTNARWQEGQ